ncbi:hypothetical protein KIH27_00525 [Mycobacterium sp. M1]|jgi:hypothetical protein|uniref:DUF222 domain-containing protein n=1 Tax=Mycolicibacter acidiphilus TaxID=2835306 RepID=A0ABS5RCQ0_9MYCO|nr:hypothetical protein [Mycolicibacter acidiphilus]MBS9532066.1 hypothetical protein [Mycolicibacter acidiphilus]TXH18793.1 MAG: hypothetical protein E6R06_25930 [Mycobacterium sp.]
MTSTDELRFAAFVAAFEEDSPSPTAEQRAELERCILSAIAADGREVVAWSRIVRSIPPELRDLAPDVVTAMWTDGTLWMCSVKGQWMLAKGDAADRARADRDRFHRSVTAPLAV